MTPTTKSKPRSFPVAWLLLAAVLTAAALLFHGAGVRREKLARRRAAAAESAVPVNVVVQAVTPMTMTNRVDLPGEARAWRDVMVKAQVDGVVTEVFVKEGDKIDEGAPLARIDARDYENALAALRAKYRLAVNNHQRMVSLEGTDAVAKIQQDQASALMHELQAQVEAAALKLERCTVRAPIGGIINSLPAVKGTLLSYGDPVAAIVDAHRLKIVVPVPESDVAAIRGVTGATVRLPAAGDLVFEARAYFLASRPTPPSMTYEMQLVIDDPPPQALPGMYARVSIVKERLDKAVALPLYAVINQDGKQFVYTVTDGVAHRRAVVTGFLQDWLVLVKQGVVPGDRVVIVGQRGLDDGQPVRVVKTVSAPEGPRR